MSQTQTPDHLESLLVTLYEQAFDGVRTTLLSRSAPFESFQEEWVVKRGTPAGGWSVDTLEVPVNALRHLADPRLRQAPLLPAEVRILVRKCAAAVVASPEFNLPFLSPFGGVELPLLKGPFTSISVADYP